MSLQWTLIAGFLYVEMAVVVLLMLPFISAKMWQNFFKSRIIRSLAAYSNFYFSAFLVILVLVFLDSLRQMHKYSSSRDLELTHGHLDAELQLSMKMFRAQRNCYIAGFALFLAPVIRRLGSLLSTQAMLKASADASLKQAQSATEAAEKLMKESENLKKMTGKETEENKKNEGHEKEIKTLRRELDITTEELERTKKKLQSVVSQAEGTNREYDRLLEEHSKLQRQLDQARGDAENKKDE
ncbi:B-cell receptor-associated protein 31-like [Uloborus diversus]|uniref:B-cell receptor-associated protein 31-like n=1 Tax=Uloborus diversus TaxID=327109 RepID=UPI0024092B8B|nr:B-cell receptor-associated protein 31-like [Uloborus diversus]XP_054718718.1 B-cell receptor-associated protein 31-like [Uloborus diversus]XP_054718719.1 B-cell receptor-associated protein 31-like [Uloborus diversus]